MPAASMQFSIQAFENKAIALQKVLALGIKPHYDQLLLMLWSPAAPHKLNCSSSHDACKCVDAALSDSKD